MEETENQETETEEQITELEENETLVLEALQAARKAFMSKFLEKGVDSSYYNLYLKVGFVSVIGEKPFAFLELYEQ